MAASTPLPTFADVVAAAKTIAELVQHPASAYSATLSAICGAEVVVVFENLQYTGSFKDRGAANRLAALDEGQRARGVVAASAGNHAQGVAYHAHRLGVPATIVVPQSAPLAKVANARRLGATVISHGDTLTESVELMVHLAASEGLTVIHPYDDPLVIAGQGTVGLELFPAHPDLDDVVIPVGGGGLASGIALAASELAPTCRLVGVQSELYPAMCDRLAGRTPATDGRAVTSIADGIAVKQPGELTTALLAAAAIEMMTVPESRIEEAVGLLVEVEKTVAEGAGAAALAALLDRPARFVGRKVAIVVSGGNIDPRLLSSVILRSLVRQQRLTRLRVPIDDLPGNLGAVATAIGRAGGNLVEVAHLRLLGQVPPRQVDLDLLVETLDAAHLQRVLTALADAGYRASVVPA